MSDRSRIDEYWERPDTISLLDQNLRKLETDFALSQIRATDEMADFDLPFAFEAMARAQAVAGDEDAARDWLERARFAGEKIVDEDDRVLLEADLATVGGRSLPSVRER